MYKIVFIFVCFEDKNYTSQYTGVSWNKQTQKWLASVNHKNKKYHIGYFENDEDAAKAVNFKCQEFKIKLKNLSVGVLNNETFKKLTAKVINSYF
jgi:hypothetical protein